MSILADSGLLRPSGVGAGSCPVSQLPQMGVGEGGKSGALAPLEYNTKSTAAKQAKKRPYPVESSENSTPSDACKFRHDFDADFWRDAADKDAPAARVFRRFHLLKTAARLLPDHRVSKCLAYVKPESGGVEVLVNRQEHRARYAKLTNCGGLYDCPICGAKISQQRNGEVKALLSGCQSSNFDVLMTTLTVSHSRYDDPRDLRSRISAATSDMFGSRAVHPRWCGEHTHRLAGLYLTHGSSPLVRGTRIDAGAQCTAKRFIPAGAGEHYQ